MIFVMSCGIVGLSTWNTVPVDISSNKNTAPCQNGFHLKQSVKPALANKLFTDGPVCEGDAANL